MLATWLKASSKYTVVFSGAGMSTESGVPDFRSKNGLWHRKNLQLLSSIKAMKRNTKEFIDFYRIRMESLHDIKPHKGYEILSTWQQNLQLKSIITQNTDGLHEHAGNTNVIPLHGTIRQLHCHSCKVIYSTEKYLDDQIYCNCGGFIRPSVVLFEEFLDSQVLAAAESETKKADLFIVLGSSLVVSPANSFPIIAKEHGAKLVIVNNDSTPLDSLVDIIINEYKVGVFLQDISDKLLLK